MLLKHAIAARIIMIIFVLGLFSAIPSEFASDKALTTSTNIEEKTIGASEVTQAKGEIPAVTEIDKTTIPEKVDSTDKDNKVINAVERTGVSQMDKSKSDYSKYGTFTIEGMTVKDYTAYRNLSWTRVSASSAVNASDIDLLRQYSYKELEDILLNLAKYDNVYVDVIGKTVQGRNIYSIAIDYKNSGKAKDVVLLTGQTHALEFAGGVYILKQLSDMLKQAKTDENVRNILENVTFKAIPVVNPDGREMILNGGDAKRKSNANGVDINRNFNSINAGQKANEYLQSSSVSNGPGLGNFPGYTLGSEPETQAVMKWLDENIATAKGKLYLLDYHQMGHVIYSDKPWRTAGAEKLTRDVQQKMLTFLNSNVSANHFSYAAEGSKYGLEGVGGTLTDYFVSATDGFTINKNSGRMMYEANEALMPLIQFRDLDSFLEAYKPVNKNCTALTIEIGSGEAALGYGNQARELMNKEYVDYNFNKLLLFTASLMSEN